ncbi:MAG TPA: TetR/AcrR family transcriptional regulator [Streptosporangiaceae bacterium]|nr:TetR/AcrR family transcriptional regulator [Streptosporangiaceae bacterium]
MSAQVSNPARGPITVATQSQRERRDNGPLTDKGQARKADLLAAARVVFERRGFLDARVADIVAEAKVAQGTFYTYFDSKEAIFVAVAQGVIDDMLASLHTDTHADDPYQRVRAAMGRFIDAYQPNARIIALTEQVGTFTPQMRELRLTLRSAFVERSARGIRRLQQEGIADPDLDVMVTAEVLGAMVDQTCYVWLILRRPFDRESLVATLTAVWARAIGVDAWTPPASAGDILNSPSTGS